MSRESAPVAIEDLLAQRAWVRALAGTLVRGDAAADDLAQEAWLAALRSPPSRGGSVRGWFAAVMRNSVRMRHRGDVRRGTRESAAAAPEATAAAADVVVRAEEHGRVVRAVLSLDEPYRTAVLLRFFDDLPPREISRRTGVPVETVRSQVRRALERLRARLDDSHGGDGVAWRAALLPLAGLPPAAGIVDGACGGGAAAAGGGTGGGAGAAAGSTAFSAGAILMGAKSAAAVGLVALAAGAAAGWLAGADDRAELAKLRGDSPAEGTAPSDAESWKSRFEELSRARHADQRVADSKLRDATAALEEAKSRVAALEAQLTAATAGAEPEGAPEAPAAGGPTFPFPDYAEVFAKLDWKSIAEHMAAMPPLISEVAAALRDGTPVPPQSAGDIQKHNGPLVTIALQLNGQLPGTGANGTFTHPAFMINAMAAVLEQAGKPLDSSQRTALEDVGRRFTAEDRDRLAGYDESTFQIRKVAEEGELRGRFFAAARNVLDADQVETLSPELTRDRLTLDIWSAGLFWAQFARPVAYDADGKFVDEVARTVTRVLKLGEGAPAERARAVVADWASRLPEALREGEADGLDRAGRLRVARVEAAAGETRRLVERLATDLALDGESLVAARSIGVIVVPVPGAGDGD